jgi:hypothetical protein
MLIIMQMLHFMKKPVEPCHSVEIQVITESPGKSIAQMRTVTIILRPIHGKQKKLRLKIRKGKATI